MFICSRAELKLNPDSSAPDYILIVASKSIVTFKLRYDLLPDLDMLQPP